MIAPTRGPLPLVDRMLEHGWAVMLYDGACVFCSGSVRFVARRTSHRLLAFTAMQSGPAGVVLERLELDPANPDTLIVLEGDAVLERSDAVLRLMELMAGPWPVLARLLRRVPRRLRDGLYRQVAANRYRLLGRRRQCMLVGPELRRRFLV